MLLSIIIPVYNLEEYIGRCLDSCLNQTLQNNQYEIICVNDGSTDHSLEILQEYEKKYNQVKVIDKKNGGVSSARNAGIQEASGRYIWFVDGDDWIRPGSLQEIERLLLKTNADPDCVAFGFSFKNTYEAETSDIPKFEWHLADNGYATMKNSYSNCVCAHWVKTSIIRINHIQFDEDMKYAEDTIFLARFRPLCSKKLILNLPLYYYFQRNESAMNRIDASQHCYCMLRLAYEYKNLSERTDNETIKIKMHNAYIRAMQAACRDLCIYCPNRKHVQSFIKMLKGKKLYPYGIDWKQFRRDPKQSLKNDLMNWLFGLLSYEVYFWLCWHLCGILFYKKRTSSFNISKITNQMELK